MVTKINIIKKFRQTAVAIPYQIGAGIFGGLTPAVSFSIVFLTGNIFAGLWYPMFIVTISFILGCLFLKDTKNVDISK